MRKLYILMVIMFLNGCDTKDAVKQIAYSEYQDLKEKYEQQKKDYEILLQKYNNLRNINIELEKKLNMKRVNKLKSIFN